MKLHNVVYASDMARSVAFYESLGLQRATTGDPDPHWNEFDLGDARLALHYGMGEELPPVGGRIDVFLVVPADGTLDRLHERIGEGKDIADVGFGRHFGVKDPDGQPIVLLEEVAS